MQLKIQKLSGGVQLNYALQEARRRRLELVACRFNGKHAYLLIAKNRLVRLPSKFTVVLERSERLPIMAQHMKLMTTGSYQTHRTQVHRYVTELVATEVYVAPIYVAL